MSVDHVIRDIILKYDIKNEDLWIQSDNASSQYKNKNSFFLLKELAKEFNLRIIRTYGAAGHGKGAIDGMSSFGVKNILRKDIVTHDIFFNMSEDVVDYLIIKCPQFNYKHLAREDIVKSRAMQNKTMTVPDCMKKHLMIFTANDLVFCKEYLCSCNSCLQFKFKECLGEDTPLYADVPCNDDFGNDEGDDDDIDKTEQIFNFLDVQSFVSLFSGSPNEPLYFVKVVEKGTAIGDLSDPYGHFISARDKFFKGFYLKMARSRQVNKKKFQVLPTEIVFTPDEVFDTYIDISEDLHLDVENFKHLIQKANSRM